MAVSVVAKFIADEWFKIMAILCFVLLVVSLTVDLKVENSLVSLFSLAGCLWGIGEMACRPYREVLMENPAGPGWAKLSGRPRRINLAAIVLFGLSLTAASIGGLIAWPMIQALIPTA